MVHDAHKVTRVAAGLYDIETGRGIVSVGRQASGLWYITWPGQSYPDDVEATLADAKAAVAEWAAEEGS